MGLWGLLSSFTFLSVFSMHACSVTQLRPTLCDPISCSPPGSPVHGTFQARILEWVAISHSRGSSPPRDHICVSCIGRSVLYHCTHLGSLYFQWVCIIFTFLLAGVEELSQEACRILAPQPQIKPRPSTVKAESPNQWTAREFPKTYFLKKSSVLTVLHIPTSTYHPGEDSNR